MVYYVHNKHIIKKAEIVVGSYNLLAVVRRCQTIQQKK